MKLDLYRQQTTTPDLPGAPRANAVTVGPGLSAGFEALGQGTRRLAIGLQEREEEDARAWSAKALADARLEWTTALIDRQSKAPPGAPGFTPAFVGDFDGYMEKAVENAPTRASKRYLAERLADLRGDLGIKATQFEAQARVDHRSDQFTAAIQSTQKLMNTDPGQYQIAMAERLAEIDGADIPPIKKSELREKAVQTISGSAVWSQIQRSPTGFLQSIGFLEGPDTKGKVRKTAGDLTGITGNPAFDALGFEGRIKMFESALRTKAQIDFDAERAGAAQKKQLESEAMKEVWSRFFDGKLNRSFLEEKRPHLSAPEYHSALLAMKKGLGDGAGPKTDPATFRELLRLQGTDPKAAEAFAFTSHKAGLLSNEHLAGEVNRVRTISRQEGPKSAYEQGRNYVVGSLDPGPLVNDPVRRSRLAEAVDTYDAWMKGGKRTDEEIDKRAKEVVTQYRFIDLSETVMALPSPRSGNIRRNPADKVGMQQDLLRAKESADKKLADKTYKQADHDKEMEILNRWRKALGPQ